jgi:hypothetical protein
MDRSHADDHRHLDAVHIIECPKIARRCQFFSICTYQLGIDRSLRKPQHNVYELTFIFTALVAFSATQGKTFSPAVLCYTETASRHCSGR